MGIFGSVALEEWVEKCCHPQDQELRAVKRMIECANAYGVVLRLLTPTPPADAIPIKELHFSMSTWRTEEMLGDFTLRFGNGGQHIVAGMSPSRSMVAFFALADVAIPLSDEDLERVEKNSADRGYFDSQEATEHVNEHRSGAAREALIQYEHLIDRAIDMLKSERDLTVALVDQASIHAQATNQAVNDYLRDAGASSFRAAATMLGKAEIAKDTLLHAMLLIGTEAGASKER